MKGSVITHVLPTIARSGGGPSVSVRRLAEALPAALPGVTQMVLAGDAAGGVDALADWQVIRPQLLPGRGPDRLGWTPSLQAALVASAPQLIHVHGLWKYHTWAAQQAARHLQVPLVVSPRGMLEPWSLRQSRPQKWLASQLFQRRMLNESACIVATSGLEEEGVRAAGYRRAPVAIVPNGVDLPPESALAHRRVLPVGEVRTALFVSRIHPKKGVMDLLSAWQAVRPAGWRLRLVGPDEGGHAAQARRFVAEHQLTATVTLEGPLWGEAKVQAYAEADLFVLPTHSENFGLVIAEALAAGLPVITTRGAPWGELVSERCGWWIEPGPDALAACLRPALATAPAELADMGRRGRALVARRYSWAAAAAVMAGVYRRLLGVAVPAPAALVTAV